MNTRDIDTDQIRIAIESLEKLASECEKEHKLAKKIEIRGCGKTKNSIETSFERSVEVWEELRVLIDKTKDYLSQLASSIDNADSKSAKSFS